MDSRPITKLLTSPITNLTWTKIQQLKPSKKDFHGSSWNSDSFIQKSTTNTNQPFAQKHLLTSTGIDKVCANGFRTSTSHSFFNKLSSSDQQQLQASAQLYAHKTEVEPLFAEGLGWAGQPVVRRTHPILPEVYGDLCDVFTAVEKLPAASSRVQEEAFLLSQKNDVTKTAPDNTRLQAVEKREGKEGSQRNLPQVKDISVRTNKTKDETKDKGSSRRSDAISLMDKNIKSGPSTHLHSEEAGLLLSTPVAVIGNVGIKEQATRAQAGFKIKKDKRIRKLAKMHLKSEFVMTKQKKKEKKKTKVCTSRANLPLMMGKKMKKSKKKNARSLGVNNKKSIQSNILLSQSVPPVRKSIIVLANRQLQTYSHANQAKVSVKVKERTSATMVIALGKKQKKSSKLVSEGRFPEDCKCPEVLETKTKFPTQICGEAAGLQDKKKKMKERKGKMCPIEHQIKHRSRTFVCNSAKFGKGKRKRQLPKCEKPEKKIASRVLVCPPVPEELKEGAKKKCVKQVEEVKIRSKTKVCKPIIIHQAEAKVVVQKAICTEKKVKKTISRHTKVCPPTEENISQKKSTR